MKKCDAIGYSQILYILFGDKEEVRESDCVILSVHTCLIRYFSLWAQYTVKAAGSSLFLRDLTESWLTERPKPRVGSLKEENYR